MQADNPSYQGDSFEKKQGRTGASGTAVRGWQIGSGDERTRNANRKREETG